jgi:hypothetical protein
VYVVLIYAPDRCTLRSSRAPESMHRCVCKAGQRKLKGSWSGYDSRERRGTPTGLLSGPCLLAAWQVQAIFASPPPLFVSRARQPALNPSTRFQVKRYVGGTGPAGLRDGGGVTRRSPVALTDAGIANCPVRGCAAHLSTPVEIDSSLR